MQTRVRLLLLVVLGLFVLAACGTPVEPTPVRHEVSVTLGGDGQGTVTSDPPGINTAAGQATAAFVENTVITLTAEPAEGSTFEGFTFDDPEGECGPGSTETTCVVTVSDAVDVTAVFALEVAPGDPVVLNVTTVGDGTVTSDPPGITATVDTFQFERGTEVTLTAVPAAGWQFEGWTPEDLCADNGDANLCVVTLDEDTTGITAEFTEVVLEDPVVLNVVTVGDGTVTSDPPGITATVDTFQFERGTEVTLTAVPAEGTDFVGWDDEALCTDNADAAVCIVTLTEDTTTITAEFTVPVIVDPVNVSVVVEGEGSVTSVPAGIDTAAGQTTGEFTEGEPVTLTATAAAGWTFTGWAPADACEGGAAVNPCVVTATEGLEVTATFDELQAGTEVLQVNVVTAGGAAGRVTSSPDGIDTTVGDSAPFEIGETVTLTAEATAEYFAGWTGGVCPAPTEPVCTFVVVAQQPAVTANFNERILATFVMQAQTDDAEEFLKASRDPRNTDGRWPLGHTYTFSDSLEFGDDPQHGPQAVGMRFAGVTVPPNANVLSATIGITARRATDPDGERRTGTGTPFVMIEGQAVADAPAFTGDASGSAGFDITDRARTAASVQWEMTEAWTLNQRYQSPDVARIVRELVAMDGWAPSNALAFIIRPTNIDSTAYRRAHSYAGAENNPDRRPALTVEYVPLPPLP
jgi:hypothetical protein